MTDKVQPRRDSGPQVEYQHEKGSEFIRCINLKTKTLAYVIVTPSAKVAEDVMWDFYYGEDDGSK